MNTANIHLQFEDLITVYLANGLSGPEKVQFETHQTGCEPCRRSLSEARRFEESLAKTLEPDRAPAGLEDQLVKSFRLAFPQAVSKQRNIDWLFNTLYRSKLMRVAYAVTAAFGMFVIGLGLMNANDMDDSLLPYMYPILKTKCAPSPAALSESGGLIDGFVDLFRQTPKLEAIFKYAEDREKRGRQLGSIPEAVETTEEVSVALKRDVGDIQKTIQEEIAGASTRGTSGKLGDIPIMGSLFGEKKLEERSNETDLEYAKNLLEEYKKVSDGYPTLGGGGGAGGRYGGQAGGRAREYDRERASREGLKANFDMQPRSASAVGEPLNPDRKIIKSGTLAFEVDSFETAYQQVVAILTEERGYIASSSATKLPNGKVRGQIVIRVLPERFDSVTLKLRSLGELKNQNVTSEDVTKQYVDLMARLKNSQALEERLVKLMKEKKGEIKDLLEVEKELANTREKIERLQGEIKYYDNLASLATLTLDIMEKDIGKPVEYVETQAAHLVMVVADVETAYPKAQAAIHSAKGQITQGQIERQNKRATGQILAYADAEQFTGLLEQLKILGEVRNFTVEQKQTAPEGVPAVSDNTKVRKERGLINLTLMPPAGEYIKTQQSKVVLETADVDGIYTKAQNIASDAQAKIMNSNINRYADYNVATVICQVEADRFQSLMDSLKGLGKVLASETVEHQQASGVDPKSIIPAPVRKDPGTIELTIKSPSAIVESDRGVLATLKNTLKGSIKGLLWSLQMLVVGLITVGPWLALLALVVILYRRLFRRTSK